MPTPQDLLAANPAPEGSDIRVERLRYEHDGRAYEGVLALDAAIDGPRPGVVIVHDWLGVGPHVETRARMLAGLGYAALAIDMYGVDIHPTPETAPQLAGALYDDLPELRARATAGLEQLLARPEVDPARVAVMGYCFGGSTAIELARSGAPLAGAVSFHGALIVHEPADVAEIRAKLLVLNGAADPIVPDERVVAFHEELRTRPELDWQFVNYSGALHAFAVPGADSPEFGAAYQEAADRRSWRAMRDFFDEIFA